MKIGSVEGTPEEIKNLFENNGLNLAQYIEKPGQHMHKGWVICPSIVFAVSIALTAYVSHKYQNYTLICFAASCAVVCWLAIAVQVKFSNGWATAISAIGPFLVILLSAGYISPSEVIPAINSLNKK